MASAEEIAAIAAAALAWFDTEAVFGTADARTAAALQLIRERVHECSREVPKSSRSTGSSRTGQP